MSKRILFIDEDQSRNGSTVSLEYLVLGFRERGYDVTVLTWKADPIVVAPLFKAAELLDGRWGIVTTITMCVHFTYTASPFSFSGVRTIIKDIAKFVAGLAIVMRAIRKSNPDVVYINEYSVVQASLAAVLMGVPAVAHIRSPILRGAFGLRRRVVSRLILGYNQKVFAISKREAIQLCPRPHEESKVTIVGEFVSLSNNSMDATNSAKESFKLPAGKKMVGMLGGIRDLKGSLDFLRAAQIVLSQRGDTVFVIAGVVNRNGDTDTRKYYETCMQIIESLERKGAIQLLGQIANPLDFIACTDLIVSPSPQTHFSRPVIEAWAYSKPVIAVRTEHMEELISDGVNGILVDAGNYVELANQISRLLSDPGFAMQIASEGRKKTEIEFDAVTNLNVIVGACDALVVNKRLASL